MPYFAFYGGRKQATTKFCCFDYWFSINWINIDFLGGLAEADVNE